MITVTYSHFGTFGMVFLFREDLQILPVAYYQTANNTIADLERIISQARRLTEQN